MASACVGMNRSGTSLRIRTVSPSISELYQGAVELLFDRPVPGFTRFVSHAVREIHNRPPHEISGLKSAVGLARLCPLAAAESETQEIGECLDTKH